MFIAGVISPSASGRVATNAHPRLRIQDRVLTVWLHHLWREMAIRCCAGTAGTGRVGASARRGSREAGTRWPVAPEPASVTAAETVATTFNTCTLPQLEPASHVHGHRRSRFIPPEVAKEHVRPLIEKQSLKASSRFSTEPIRGSCGSNRGLTLQASTSRGNRTGPNYCVRRFLAVLNSKPMVRA